MPEFEHDRAIIPVTLLTGFLGAGKTTLLGKLLRDPRFSDTAVLINEFGEVALDHLLVEAVPEDISIEVTSGCLCCTVRGDIRQALMMILHRSEIGELPMFSRLVIETTGIADPAPVIQTLMGDILLARRYQLASIVTVVDAVNGLSTIVNHLEARKQIAVADRIVVTKTDTDAGSAALPDVLRMLGNLAPGATIADAHRPGFLFGSMIDDERVFDPAVKPKVVLDWLAAESHREIPVGHAHQHDHGHDGHAHGHHDEHHHDVNRHGDNIKAFCLTLDRPLDLQAFGFAMELLASNQGPDVLRVKGLVAISEYPDQPVIIHMVQHVLHVPARLDAWPSADKRTRLVFITRNIDPERLARFFDSWSQPPPYISQPFTLSAAE